MGNQKCDSIKRRKHIISPLKGGKIDKISPLLKYERPFSPPDSFNEIILILQNYTDQRIEGRLDITSPHGWTIAPGNQLMIAIRPKKMILAEFYLSIPERPAPGSHILRVKITSEKGLLAEAAFDLRPGLLFIVDNSTD